MRFWFLFLLTIASCAVLAQTKLSPQAEAFLIKDALLKYHIKPAIINDSFSKEAFEVFFETLDPDRVYFTASDIENLRKYSTLIDDELNGKYWGFVDQFIPVYKNALQRAVNIIEKESKEVITEQYKDSFVYDTTHWPADAEALQVKWRKWYRLQVLDRLADMYSREENPAADFYLKREPEARLKVKAQLLRGINRVRENPVGFEQYVHTMYFQTICSLFDPHTTYLSKTEVENMLSSLSTEGYYFGVSLDENKRGDVIIVSLVPGSPAWKCGELQANDILVSLRWNGQQEIDMVGISSEEANEILSDANHQEIEFVVQKSNGAVRKAKLKKEKLSMEENFVRSYVLKGERTFGYISLPDFYTQWGDESEGSRCANDVAREIIKLRSSNIQGLILDIRGNSGGSMQEALAMAGIFIDEGALGITHNEGGGLVTLRDMNRGTVYDGPLVVLVNGHSASASELLAGVLQDYNRAIIVGEKTYGKGSMQNFFPIQAGNTVVDYNQIKSSMLKITTDRFYRVTGKSIQSKGVVPDIRLPDMFEAINYFDGMLPHALSADSVIKNTYYKPLTPKPIGSLKDKSTKRISEQESFNYIGNWTKWLAAIVDDDNAVSEISWSVTKAEVLEEKKMYHGLEQALLQPTKLYEVIINPIDLERSRADDYITTFNNNWIDNLKHDIYISEAYSILNDLLVLTEK